MCQNRLNKYYLKLWRTEITIARKDFVRILCAGIFELVKGITRSGLCCFRTYYYMYVYVYCTIALVENWWKDVNLTVESHDCQNTVEISATA